MAGQIDLKKSSNGKFFFTLKTSNGQAILSSEMYETRASANKGIASVQKNGADANRFQRLEAKDGSPYFVLKAGNHQVIGQSQMYKSEASRDNGIESVIKHAPEATVNDLTAEA